MYYKGIEDGEIFFKRIHEIQEYVLSPNCATYFKLNNVIM